jgi:hypothetical protein
MKIIIALFETIANRSWTERDPDCQRTQTLTERGFGLSVDTESPYPFHAHDQSASVDCPRTIRICCMNCFTDVAWLLRDLLRQCCVDDSLAVAQPLRQSLRGHSSDVA